MRQIVSLLDQVAFGLYVILAVAGIWLLQKWSGARYAARATMFELERNHARNQIGNYTASIILVLEAGLFVFGIQRVVLPQMREDDAVRQSVQALLQQQTMDDDFVTPTFSVPEANPQIVDPVDPAQLGGAPEQGIVATAAPTATLVGTIEPNAPDVIGCNTPNAFLQIPANGMRIFQQTPVVGTAFVDNFSSYKIEIKGPGIPDFAVLDEATIPVLEQGALSQFNPAPYERGTYQFRLMVFDTTTALKASCQVTIYVTDPPLTSTPIPTVQPGAPPAFATLPGNS
jgi:hypothetical protein